MSLQIASSPISNSPIKPIDFQLLGWLSIWSILLSVTTRLTAVMGFSALLGLSMGCLIVTWAATGSWLVLIDVPAVGFRPDAEATDTTTTTPPQQVMPRIVVALFLFFNVALFAFGDIPRTIVGETAGTAFAAVIGATLVWQWTRRRISRSMNHWASRRSIRQLMGLSVTIAILLAILGPSVRWANLKSASVGMMVAVSLTWVISMAVLLSSRWWMAFGLPMLVLLSAIAVSFLIDGDGRDIDADIQRMSGILCGSYLFGVLLLLLMKSSRHRWFH
ncbi:MAG: hypothetical protein AAF802_04950 [Planctomycetota bacterium]